MPFTKKTWVNVPDASNLPPIPEGQDYLARFDAENMNRIEDGIEEVTYNVAKHTHSAGDVGLANVPNVTTNDQTPTYTEASTLTTLTSGEKLSIAFGKIKKAITDFISHNEDTTKHITSTERTTWNNKASGSHTHTKSQVTDFPTSMTPTAHTHPKSQITDFPTSIAPVSHASTATTYGVGTSSNYGHLKITDSKTSTATDTAASAKALKEVNDATQSGAWKLLKEMSVNLVTAQGQSTAKLGITGLTNLKVEQVKFVFEGTLSFTHLRDSTVSNSISIYLGDGDNSTFLLYRYTNDSFTNGKAVSTNLSLRQIQYKNVYSNVDDWSFTILKGNSIYATSPDDIELMIVTTNTTFMTPTLVGTLKVYTRGE